MIELGRENGYRKPSDPRNRRKAQPEVIVHRADAFDSPEHISVKRHSHAKLHQRDITIFLILP